jgi:hypothetical protein
MLWGIEGKQLNRNVGLTNLSEKLRMLDKGEIPLGIEALSSAAGAEATVEPVDAVPVSPETPATP